MRVSRSVLAVPASNPKMAGTALASAADAVFLDLEDAVAPVEKVEARRKVIHALKYAMHRIVVAARAAGLRAIDGPLADYRNEEGLRKSCLLARSLGFEGKWCIHPAQIEIVNEIFSPTEREVEWAQKVADAYEEASSAGTGAISVEGQMVDAASIKMALNTLELARASGKI